MFNVQFAFSIEHVCPRAGNRGDISVLFRVFGVLDLLTMEGKERHRTCVESPQRMSPYSRAGY